MSDLYTAHRDQKRATTDRNHFEKPTSSDLLRRGRDLLLPLLLAACASVPAPVNSPVSKPEVWVDSYAKPAGDGSPQHPFKTVPAGLQPGTVLNLASGLYRGPFDFTEQVEVVGHGSVVLFLDGPGVVVTVRAGRFTGVSFQGGTTGLAASASVSVESAHFSGQSLAALQVAHGAEATVTTSVFEGTLPDVKGVLVDGGSLTLRDCQFRGGLKRAVEAQSSPHVSLTHVSSEGVSTVLHAIDTTAQVTNVEVAAGRGPAIFCAGGSLTVNGLSVIGQEYAVQAVRAHVSIDDVLSRDPQFSGIALQKCGGTLSRVRVTGAGTLGGIQLVDSEGLTVRDTTVSGAESTGFLIRGGAVSLRGVRVDSVRSEGKTGGEPVLGDGLQLRDAHVTLEAVEVRDVEGSAVWVSALAEVTSGRLDVERTGNASLVVERGGSFKGGPVVIHGAHGPAILASDGAKVTVTSLTALGVEGPVWAECEQGVLVRIDSLVSESDFAASRCVDVGARGSPPRAR